jgi:dTDP-4-dehydrorhamnose 3,5-epimerase
MIFTETKLAGAYVIEPEPIEDERGFFARTFCMQEFADYGLIDIYVQSNISYNRRKGTLRGMHYQAEPKPETKLVSCTMGAIYDVILDLRPDSPTFTQWFALELSAQNHRTLYVPVGFAHGFQALVDNTEVSYQMSEYFYPQLARGVRWNDPAFGIQWPDQSPFLSVRDNNHPDFVL